ncbi:MAG: Ti-type conjugative transfer relaxase TraA, partial [Pseudorhodoplanes sp.]
HRVSVDQRFYRNLDHGYATTIHKSQGATVDRAYVLASEGMDRHLSYVAMTRHRQEATLYAGRDQFADLRELSARLSRSGAKETTLDYAERRGIASEFGVRGEIEVARDAQRQRQAPERDAEAQGPERERPSVEAPGEAAADRQQALIQQAKLAFYKSHGAAKAREAFQQAEARRAAEAEAERRLERERQAELDRDQAPRQRFRDLGLER